MLKRIAVLVLLSPMFVWALTEEEKNSTCKELGLSVLPVQRALAVSRCVEFAGNECDRIERSFLENCLETSHLDNAIKFDIERGSSGACQAAIMKRETQRDLCESLRRECRETKISMGGGGAEANCTPFRNEDNKKICAEVEIHAKRIAAAEQSERQLCATKTGAVRPAVPTTSHGLGDASQSRPSTQAPAVLPALPQKAPAKKN